MDAAPKTYTFTAAAVAAGFTSKQLRYLLNEVEVGVEGDAERHGPKGSKWRRFTVADIFLFTLIGRLMTYGVEAKTNAITCAQKVSDAVGLNASHDDHQLAALCNNWLLWVEERDGKMLARTENTRKHKGMTMPPTDAVVVDLCKLAIDVSNAIKRVGDIATND